MIKKGILDILKKAGGTESALPRSLVQSSGYTGPKHYADACQQQSSEYSDYENAEVEFGFQDDYEFVCKLGRGRYSEVFRGVNLLNNEACVVKILKPGNIG